MRNLLIFAGMIFSVGVCANGNEPRMNTNGLTETPVATREIDRLIAMAPAMMLSQTNNVRDYIELVCEKISRCPSAQMRHAYFRNLMASACRVDIRSAERAIPGEKIEMQKVDDPWKTSIPSLEDRARRRMEQKLASIRGGAYGRLRLMADEIFNYLLVAQSELTPCTELLEPYFKLLEKLKEEEQRVGRKEYSFYDHVVDQAEFFFNFTCLSVLEAAEAKPDPQDRAAVEARFKQVVGRPIRSAEQYKADSNRRMEANIREHREQEEANRRAAESQKRFNEKRNIKEE